MIGVSTTTSAERSYRFDVRQFHRTMAAGVFKDQKVELIAGRIYVMTDLPPHTFAVRRLNRGLLAMLATDQWTVSQEQPVLLGRFWAPKPDIAILRGDDTHYATRHPRRRDVAFLIEISDTTYSRDRGRKWRRYAAVGVPTYIIVRLKGPDTVVEVWTGPAGRGLAARYTDVIRYTAPAGESVPIEIDGHEYGRIAVADLIARPA